MWFSHYIMFIYKFVVKTIRLRVQSNGCSHLIQYSSFKLQVYQSAVIIVFAFCSV